MISDLHKTTVKGKGDVIALNGSHSSTMKHHLPQGITQCYLPPDTVNVPHLNPSQIGWY